MALAHGQRDRAVCTRTSSSPSLSLESSRKNEYLEFEELSVAPIDDENVQRIDPFDLNDENLNAQRNERSRMNESSSCHVT